MADAGDGQIVTFYSYKGGTGRTMALANVAWIIAANGKRVLAADWDLESPGLHRFFHPFLDTDIRDAPGIIDLIRDYEWAAVRNESRLDELVRQRARVEPHAFSLNWEFPDGGSLDILSPGRQNSDYATTLSALDWETFYDRLNGAQFFDALRADMKSHYDYILIDSRTGLSDIADICTVHLPDVLIDCFTLSTQGIEGAAQVARIILERYASRGIRTLPVPMRVDQAEKEKVDAGLAVAARLFAGLPEGISKTERRDYWAAIRVPYRVYYAYEETLAVFGDAPGSPDSLLSAFERIAAQITRGQITALPPMEEAFRLRTRQLFTRRPPSEGDEIVLDCSPEDQIWGEWIAGVLTGAGFQVRGDWTSQPAQPAMVTATVTATATAMRSLAVISPAYAARTKGRRPADTPSLAVYLADTHPLPEYGTVPSESIAGRSEQEAIDRLLRLLGAAGRPAGEERTIGIRYPGTEPAVSNLPARNPRFTGREADLRRLREDLRTRGSAVVLPLALQGLGGVGKTQLALEYAHRFQNDYDLVWWMSCGQPQFIDAALVDLSELMRKPFGLNVPAGATLTEMVREVLRTLAQSRMRWLMIFDNADDIEAVEPFLPKGNGHVLITSRNLGWSDRGRSLEVDVFTRAESVKHLRDRVETLSAADADRVAQVLGDLPLAVATAGAWLAETGASVSGYLRELEQRGPKTLSISRLADYPEPVAQAWDISLTRLKERSTAAYRLLELCSVMSPEIDLDLLYNETMMDILQPLDPALAEPMFIGKPVQEINRLALIRVDPNAHHVQVHRLVQAVVHDRMDEAAIDAARRDVRRILVAIRPKGEVDDPETWEQYRKIWPHLLPARARWSRQEAVRRLLIDRVRYLWRRDDLERARGIATDVDATWQEMLSAEIAKGDGADANMVRSLTRQLLHLRFNLANVLRDLDRFEESHAMDAKVIADQRELLGSDDPHTLMTAGGLAADLRALGQYRQAATMDEATHTSWVRLYSEDHPRALAAANNLAHSYRLIGNFTSALVLDESTLRRRRATLGALHPNTLLSAIQVVRGLLEAGRYREAATRMEEVWTDCVQALGADSKIALTARTQLGIALRSAGQPDLAETHFLEAKAGFAAGALGLDSSDALACRLSHSANMLVLDRTSEAEAEISSVLTVYAGRLGDGHPHTLGCKVNLASALRLADERERAFAAARSATEGLTAALGEDHPYTLAARMVVAVLLADEGNLDESAALDTQTLARLTRVLGPDHPDTGRCHANLQLTRQEQGIEGAADARAEVIEQLKRRLGARHPTIDTLMGGRRLLRAVDPQPF